MFGKEHDCFLSRDAIEQKASALLGQMTLKEKVWMLSGNWDVFSNILKHGLMYNPTPTTTYGVRRLGISPIRFSDGPRGVVTGRSTCFPVAMARGASFDRNLERRIGDAIGREVRAQGANVFGGVCINLLRHPAWGRAQETYGEDPYLVGEMGKSLAQSVQAHNVMACVKHFALNNIENNRFYVNVQVGARALHEVYLPQFKKVIQAGAASVMGAYNLVRGDHACESRLLLTQILREEWGFEGYTMSDWVFGIYDGKKAIQAGMDVEMPVPLEYQRKLLQAVEQGEVAESIIDRSVLRLLRTQLVFKNTPDPMVYEKKMITCDDHIALAREAAERSMVLIKNNGQVLPFSRNIKRILVLGRLANQENTGDRGSSQVFPPSVITPLEGIRNYLGGQVEVIHFDESQLATARELAAGVDCVIIIAGYDYEDEGEFISPGGLHAMTEAVSKGYKNMGKPLKSFLVRSMSKFFMSNRKLDAKVFPGGDRRNLSIRPEQHRLIHEVGAINPNTVVCLVTGSMVMMDDWAEKTPAILYSWYGGMEGGKALAHLLFGEVNPSGKLPFTTPTSTDHLPFFSNSDREITYDLYHGYTLLEKNRHQPQYPFGHGLSYTTFQYSDLRVTVETSGLKVTVNVANTGSRDGEEIIQVYIGMDGSKVERPGKLLKGFEKVFIPAGSGKEVEILVPLEELYYYDEGARSWQFEPGVYRVMVGPSSDEKQLIVHRVKLQ